jgi:hypothetical protein
MPGTVRSAWLSAHRIAGVIWSSTDAPPPRTRAVRRLKITALG